jgi:hypothetical protein
MQNIKKNIFFFSIKDENFIFRLKTINTREANANSSHIKGVFEIVVAVVVQSIFHLEMYQNNFFIF